MFTRFGFLISSFFQRLEHHLKSTPPLLMDDGAGSSGLRRPSPSLPSATEKGEDVDVGRGALWLLSPPPPSPSNRKRLAFKGRCTPQEDEGGKAEKEPWARLVRAASKTSGYSEAAKKRLCVVEFMCEPGFFERRETRSSLLVSLQLLQLALAVARSSESRGEGVTS